MSPRSSSRGTRAAVGTNSTYTVSQTSHQILKELVEQTDQTMMDFVDKALDAYRRKLFLERL